MGKIKWNNKKTNILLLGILGVGLLVGALFFWIEYPRMKEFGAAGIFTEEEVREKTEELIGLFSAQNYQEILDSYGGKAFQKTADVEKLENAAIFVSTDWGDFQEISDITLGEMKKAGKWYAVAESQVVYEHVTVTFTFSFDKDMKLAGVHLKQEISWPSSTT